MKEIRYNANFNERIVIRPTHYQWVDSPMPGVKRMMLDRIGGEVARATSLVRYAPNSQFSQHTHSGGEEFYVLEGVFADEHGNYPAGTYMRNPIGTSHTPMIGDDGATILVKLHQFDASDTEQKSIDCHTAHWKKLEHEGIDELLLHDHSSERVTLLKFDSNTELPRISNNAGAEILVLEGTVFDELGEYPAGTWIRNPPAYSQALTAKDKGAMIYLKTGHLSQLLK